MLHCYPTVNNQTTWSMMTNRRRRIRFSAFYIESNSETEQPGGWEYLSAKERTEDHPQPKALYKSDSELEDLDPLASSTMYYWRSWTPRTLTLKYYWSLLEIYHWNFGKIFVWCCELCACIWMCVQSCDCGCKWVGDGSAVTWFRKSRDVVNYHNGSWCWM